MVTRISNCHFVGRSLTGRARASHGVFFAMIAMIHHHCFHFSHVHFAFGALSRMLIGHIAVGAGINGL